MYNISELYDRYPSDYLINMDILGNGYRNPIYVSFVPVDLDEAICSNDKKRVRKLIEKHKNDIAKDLYNKLYCIYGG